MHPNDVAELGYFEPRVLPTGELAALNKFLFTVGILAGIDEFSYRCRWCFESAEAASRALQAWDGRDDPPGPWIKQKGKNDAGEVVDRGNPATCEHKLLSARGMPCDSEIYCADCGLVHRAAADFAQPQSLKHE